MKYLLFVLLFVFYISPVMSQNKYEQINELELRKKRLLEELNKIDDKIAETKNYPIQIKLNIKNIKINDLAAFFDAPDILAERISLLKKGTSVNVVGLVKEFAKVKPENSDRYGYIMYTKLGLTEKEKKRVVAFIKLELLRLRKEAEKKMATLQLEAEKKREKVKKDLLRKKTASNKKVQKKSNLKKPEKKSEIKIAKKKDAETNKNKTSTLESKVKFIREKYQAFDNEILLALQNQRLITGMTKEMIIDSWGEPAKKSQINIDGNKLEQWHYKNDYVLVFSKYKLSRWYKVETNKN